MSVSRRRKVAVGVFGTLATLYGVDAGWNWLENTRLVNQITRAFISPELEEALVGIKGVVAAFERDVRTDVKWDWARDRVPSALVNLLILNTIHERAAALQTPPSEGLKGKLMASDDEVGREAARYIRFASAAYGLVMLKGANVMSWDSGWPPISKFSLAELNSWCITKHCGIPDQDLVKVNLMEVRKLHLPGYMIAVDHATRSVVLSVRGTFSMQDTVTDLVCDSAEFMGGACHRGLRQSAETLLEDVQDDLLKQLARNKGYRLVLCGHSLGGGVSTLLTMMILDRKRDLGFDNTEVLCYSFAPPPVFGPLDMIPTESQRAIRSFVFGNDMICRLSLASAYNLFRDLKEVDAIGASLPSRCKYLASERRPHLSVDDDGHGAVGMRIAYRYATILNRTRSRGLSRGSKKKGDGGVDENHNSVEAFVQKKLAADFTASGTAIIRPREPLTRKANASGAAAWRGDGDTKGVDGNSRELTGYVNGGDDDVIGPLDRYTKLSIPGTVYHMKKLGPESSAAAAAAAVATTKVLGETSREQTSRLYWMERQAPSEFERLLMVDTAILDHLPIAYEDALHSLYGDGLPRGVGSKIGDRK